VVAFAFSFICSVSDLWFEWCLEGVCGVGGRYRERE